MTRRRTALRLGALPLAALLLAIPSMACAGEIVLQDASTADYPTVQLEMVLSADLIPEQGKPAFAVTENGVEVRDLKAASSSENRDPIDVLLLMDTSGSMKGKPLSNAKDAAKKLVQAMGSSDRVALVSFSSEPTSVVGFSSDRATLEAGIDSLAIGGETALYDGLIQSARLFERGEQDRYIVVLSDGNDTSSINRVDTALSSIDGSGVVVYAVALSSPDYDPSVLDTLAKQSGGRLIGADSADQLASIFQGIAEELRNLYTVTYTSAKPSTKDLEVQVSVANGDEEGSLSTAVPNPLFEVGGLAAAGRLVPTQGSLVIEILIALLFAAAVAGMVYTIISMFSRGTTAEERLRYYDQDESLTTADGPSVSASRNRVLEAVAVVVERRGLTGLVRSNLERAGLPLRPNEYIFLHLLVTAVAGFATQLLWGRMLISIVVVVVFVVTPMVLLAIKVDRRRAAFEEQLPDVLGLIAGSLRAGWGIQQSIELVVEEIADPAASEFRRAQSEARFGLPLDQALGRMAERLDSEDFRWTVTALTIQREVGGNLAEVLDIVATSIRLRAELRRHVSALTAETRYSLIVLTILPVFLLAALFVVNPRYAILMTSTTVGLTALAIGLVLLIIGIVWINRLTKIEV